MYYRIRKAPRTTRVGDRIAGGAKEQSQASCSKFFCCLAGPLPLTSSGCLTACPKGARLAPPRRTRLPTLASWTYSTLPTAVGADWLTLAGTRLADQSPNCQFADAMSQTRSGDFSQSPTCRHCSSSHSGVHARHPASMRVVVFLLSSPNDRTIGR